MKWLRANYWVLGLFILVNVIFNRQMWGELFDTQRMERVSDGTITEFIIESGYQKLRSGENVYTSNHQVIYPFGVNYTMNDPGMSLVAFFVFLRPFLSIHASMLIAMMVSLFMGNILMFVLLRRLGIQRPLAVLFAVVFGFTPFLSHRLLGHYTYISLYLFPLVYLAARAAIHAKGIWQKMLTSVALGLSLALSLQTNFYYFIMISLSVAVYVGWYLLTQTKATLRLLVTSWAQFILAGIAFFAGIYPWLLGAREVTLFSGRVATEGFGGAIHYSADLFNLFTPNEYNPIYHRLFTFLATIHPLLTEFTSFYFHNWERFVYPGIIIIVMYIWLLIRRQHLEPTFLSKIKLPLVASLFFIVLTLGPFLKIAGTWSIDLDGVAVVLPLPFLILHYIPGLEGIRVPGRFMAGAIFFACMVSAWIAQRIIFRLAPNKRRPMIAGLFLIFLVDQFFTLPKPVSTPIPVQIYQTIARSQSEGVVMDIPYTLRDGFRYIGFVHAIGPMQGAMIHHRPIIGGYFARLPEPIFSYYRQLPFVNYIAEITDRGNYDPNYETPQDPVLKPYTHSLVATQEELDFLGITDFVVKMDEPYSSLVAELLIKIGGTAVSDDHNYRLYRRAIGSDHKFNKIQLGGNTDYLYVGQGFAPELGNSRKMIESRGRLFVRAEGDEQTLTLTASSPHKQIVEVYMNEQKLGSMMTSPKTNEFTFIVAGKLQKHLNVLFLQLVTPEDEQKLGGVDFFSLRLGREAHAQ